MLLVLRLLLKGLTGTPNVVVGNVVATGATFSGIVTALTFVGDLSGTATQSTETLNLNSQTNYIIDSDKILSAGIGSFWKNWNWNYKSWSRCSNSKSVWISGIFWKR